MVFSNAVLRWKNASALPGQSSGSKGFFSVKWNNKNLCDWKHSPFAATGLLLFLFVFIGVVRAKLGLKVFWVFLCFFLIFFIHIYSTIIHQIQNGGGWRKSTEHTPLQKCGGVLHHDCGTHLGWLMFARCAVQVGVGTLTGPYSL